MNARQQDYVYYLYDEAEIELYDPVKEREISGDKRVYLKFLNNSLLSRELGVFEFMKQYGFLGYTSNVGRTGRHEKLIDSVSKFHLEEEYFSDDSESYLDNIKEDIMNYKPYGKRVEKQWAKSILGVAPKGYFELATDAKSYFTGDLLGVIQGAYMENNMPNEKFYDPQIEYSNIIFNWFMCDLVPVSVNKRYKLQIEYGYRTLISFMYYELFQDLKHNIIPMHCSECIRLYLPEDLVHYGNNKYLCRECANK